MRFVEPKVFLVAETTLVEAGLDDYLNEVGATSWETDAYHDAEELVEVMGRMCYRSFLPGLNPNVTRVREGNVAYLGNIIKVGHGSVLEHASASFIFHNVSRVFTHELVRHRVGTAMSQESLRFVRLEDLGLWMPSCVEAQDYMAKLFMQTFTDLEDLQIALAKAYDLDNPDTSFADKKTISSAMRRVAPIGLATSIGFTMNFRALRHIIQMRTSRHAEEEIRLVFDQVATIAAKRWPAVFCDFTREEVQGHGEWTTPNNKV